MMTGRIACDPFPHKWVNDYYGFSCANCDAWFSHGNAPWDEGTELELDDDGDEPWDDEDEDELEETR